MKSKRCRTWALACPVRVPSIDHRPRLTYIYALGMESPDTLRVLMTPAT